MADKQGNALRPEPKRIFVKADEIDAGTSILTPSKQLPLSALAPPDASAPAAARPKAPPRPALRRDGPAAPPPPPSQPPPAPPNESVSATDITTDSLSLPQLKHLVGQFPKAEQCAYAFQYSDSEDFAVELEEWFHYAEQDHAILLASRDIFEQIWADWYQQQKQDQANQESETWLDVSHQTRVNFVKNQVPKLDPSAGFLQRIEALECLLFILSGVWGLSAGLETHQEPQ